MNSSSQPPQTLRRSLGKRLKVIADLIGGEYEYIWDCCCDHGLLGMTLLDRQAAPHVHFVDISEALIQKLERNLTRYCNDAIPQNQSWRSYAQDASTIPVSKFTGRQLVVIAGVGGDLTKKIIESLVRNQSTYFQRCEMDFLLCPVRHLFTLRKSLAELGFRLKKELLVEENSRIYEVMLVTLTCKTDTQLPLVNTAGSEIWRPEDNAQKAVAKRYLDKTIDHYSRMKESGSKESMLRLKAYQALKID